jgi:DNA-binding transcriptional ArsR family regulator
MDAVADQLQQYATAVSDPTRGMILMELDRAGELTATQLARRLGLTPNNVYHHMRVLRRLDVVEPPRPVPGETYVEKYYRLRPEIQAAVRLEPDWYDQVQTGMTTEDRRAVLASMCLTMAHLLRQAARHYQEMDADTLDEFARQQKLILLSVQEVSRERLQFRLEALREVLAREGEQFAGEPSPPTDLLLIAGLPSVWDGFSALEDTESETE